MPPPPPLVVVSVVAAQRYIKKGRLGLPLWQANFRFEIGSGKFRCGRTTIYCSLNKLFLSEIYIYIYIYQ